jgi:hypothetical protein
MGKASRAKKEQRQAMAGKPGWQQEASRQAKERQREEINSHNAAMNSDQIERFKSSSDQVALMIDGKLYSGKKELDGAYASLTQHAIESDSPALLEKYVDLEHLLETSIWDAKVSVLDMNAGGVNRHLDPLTAALTMDKEKCFGWLVNHALKSEEGCMILNVLFSCVIPLVDGMDKTSARLRSVKLMSRKIIEHWLDNGNLEILEQLNMLVSLSETIREVFRQVRAQRESMMQREEIEKWSAKPADFDDGEPNPEAIRLADEVLGAAQETSKSEKSGRGWARAL